MLFNLPWRNCKETIPGHLLAAKQGPSYRSKVCKNRSVRKPWQRQEVQRNRKVWFWNTGIKESTPSKAMRTSSNLNCNFYLLGTIFQGDKKDNNENSEYQVGLLSALLNYLKRPVINFAFNEANAKLNL